VMFILGTSTVLTFIGGEPINVIGPIPQTFRTGFGPKGAASLAAKLRILLLRARAVPGAGGIFTGLAPLPMATGWDNLVPRWFARLDERRRTPVNSIYFVAALVMGLILLSLLGVREQEASQLLTMASIVHYAIAYVTLFALPLFGRAALRRQLPRWLKVAAAAGMASSLVAFAGKICAVVAVSNMAGVLIYRVGQARCA